MGTPARFFLPVKADPRAVAHVKVEVNVTCFHGANVKRKHGFTFGFEIKGVKKGLRLFRPWFVLKFHVARPPWGLLVFLATARRKIIVGAEMRRH